MENSQTKVTVSLGYTMNVGNFQSLRIDIGVEDQLRDGEHVQEGFDRVYSFVEQQLTAKLQEAKSEIAE
jgi:hypothetical protein